MVCFLLRSAPVGSKTGLPLASKKSAVDGFPDPMLFASNCEGGPLKFTPNSPLPPMELARYCG